VRVAETVPGGPRATYVEGHAHHAGLRDAASARSRRLSNLRAATFLAAAAAWLASDVGGASVRPWAFAALGLLALGFVAQVVAHRRVKRRERWEGALASLAHEGVLRLDRDWSALEEALPARERTIEELPVSHPYARDLAVVGSVSLARLCGPVTSERGRALLRAWLLEPAAPEIVRSRQDAARELAALPELRAEIVVLGRLEGPERLTGVEPFLAWCEAQDADDSVTLRERLAWVVPPVLVAGIAADVALGWAPWWIVPALFQVLLARRHGPGAREAFAKAEPAAGALRALAPQLRRLDERSWTSTSLRSLAERMGAGDVPAHEALARLSRLLDTVESRRNLVYAALAPGLLLEIHLAAALRRWRRRHGASARAWIEALGEWEALAALATVAHDHPDWSYPSLAASGDRVLEATSLGHPLLPPASCVRNDVALGPPGMFLFVTGSNMSGKSTLLRALGANAVLAAAGAPVCARALSLPPVRVYTSMRVEDSLTEGVSLFMAELLRLKQVVEGARRAQAEGSCALYLLDEILHGTNTEERSLAARAILRHLLASGAIGAVSTHDLTLADTPDLRSAAQAVHFREDVRRPDTDGVGTSAVAALSFDYLLRPGVATTRNALALLEAVGLGDAERS